jgi:hypothetical protein
MIRWLWISVALAACSPALAPASRRPDGGWHLRCGAALEACVEHAAQLCKDRGFLVLSGMSKRHIYGAELGVSQVVVRDAELDVACADRSGELPTLASAAPLPNAAAPDAPPAPSALPPNAAEHVISSAHLGACTPGSTQRCVGAAACSGGQACLADGSGFGACDCGTAPAPAPTPALKAPNSP